MIDAQPTSLKSRKHGGSPGRRRRDRRYALIVGVVFILGSGIVVLTVGLATSRHSADLPVQKGAMSGLDTRSGSIIDHTNGRCRQAFFDNDSGRVVDAGEPCKDGSLSNGKGDPTRTGTGSRLDAISKSFFKSK